MYTESYRNTSSTVRSILDVESTDSIEKGQLFALNVENCHFWPVIAKVLEIKAETIDIVWLEGSYCKPWKVAKKKQGHVLVEWIDSVPKSSVLLFDFQFTKNR